MFLNESLYLKGLQCPKLLWLQANDPKSLNDTALPEEDFQRVSTEDVDRLAGALFPDGVNTGAANLNERIRQTAELMDTGPVTLFGAAFEYEGLQVVLDILKQNESGVLSLYNVKAITRIRRSHTSELAFQYHVLSSLGFQVESAQIICLNKSYVREGALDPDLLFRFNDLSKEVRGMQKELAGDLDKMRSALHGPLPDQPIGTFCTGPRPCEAKSLCWHSVPSPSVFEISGLSPELKMKFYNKGIITFSQIDDFADLSAHQKLQVECELSGESRTDPKELHSFLATLSCPVSHLDFEAFQQAVPLWDGVRPYSHIPFQYSLHVEGEDGSLEHREYLADPGTDPRRMLAEKLIDNCPEDGTVLVYNQAFEKKIIKGLSELYPDLSESLMNISNRIVDLMIPFKNKTFYSPVMKGKYSIKNVLPALVPEMADAYNSLDQVHNGFEAMRIFSEMKASEADKKEALLKYCELDTLAMVRILAALRLKINENL